MDVALSDKVGNVVLDEVPGFRHTTLSMGTNGRNARNISSDKVRNAFLIDILYRRKWEIGIMIGMNSTVSDVISKSDFRELWKCA